MIKHSKFFIVVKREYLRIVKSKSFWLSTLMLPLLMIVIGGISYYSQNQLQEKMETASKEAKLIYVYDKTGIIDSKIPYFTSGTIKITDNVDASIAQVKAGVANAVIEYPADLFKTQKIIIYAQDQGITSVGQFDNLAKDLLKQSVLSEIGNPTKASVFTINFSIDQHSYKDGKENNLALSNFVLPFISIIAYILFTSFSTSYLLMSVSEEKENRMIEIILSSISSRELIWGKIIGQVAVILTQMALLIGFALIALKIATPTLPFDLGQIQINPIQIVLTVVYVFMGFLILANTMVAAGASMPNYKDAQSFSTIFILLSVMPLYTITLIMADPNSLIAYVMSYFPYSAPTILLLRNSIGLLNPIEIVLSIIVLLFYIYITGMLAYKLFEFGALEYNQKISFSNFFKTFKIKKGN